MTNVTNRVPSLKSPATIVDVFSAADLPPSVVAPDGVTRCPIVAGVTYRVHESFVWPMILVPVLRTFIGPDPISIVGATSGVNVFFVGSGPPSIWGRNIGLFLFRNIIVIDAGNFGAGRSTVLFDLVGAGPAAGLSSDFSAFVNFKAVGRTMDAGLPFGQTFFSGNEAGIASLQSGDFSFTQPLLSPLFSRGGAAPMKKPVFFFNCSNTASSASISSGAIANGPGDSLIAIDSGSIGDFAITSMGYPGSEVGNFFRPDVSLGLTAMADVSKSITAFAADAVSVVAAAPGPVGTIFVTGAVQHQWKVGDTVTHTGFAVGAYNGVKTIAFIFDPFSYGVASQAFVSSDTGTATNDLATVCTSAGAGFTKGQTILVSGGPAAINGANKIKSVAADEDSFILAVDFGTVGAGTGTIEITRITTDADHPMFAGETQTISGTTSYNFTTGILFTPTDNTFDVPLAFVADDATGTVSSVSKNQESLGIDSVANGAQQDSRRLAFGRMNANAVVTTISVMNTYQAVDLGTLLDSPETERFTLIDATAGIYRYDDTRPLDVAISAQITAIKSGSLQNYRFSASINGAIPVFATAFYAPMEVKTTKVSASPIGLQPIVQNDTLQIMVAAEGHTDSLTITDIGIIFSG